MKVLTSWDALLMSGFRVPPNVKKLFNEFEEPNEAEEEKNEEDTFSEPSMDTYIYNIYDNVID